MNFLIAIISESYANVMSKTIVSLYASKCDFNEETCILVDAYNKVTGGGIKSRIFILSANIETKNENNQWAGFVRVIKNSIEMEVTSVKKEVIALRSEMEKSNTKNTKMMEEIKDLILKKSE